MKKTNLSVVMITVVISFIILGSFGLFLSTTINSEPTITYKIDVITAVLKYNNSDDELRTQKTGNDSTVSIDMIEEFETSEFNSEPSKLEIFSNVDYQMQSGNAYFSVGYYEQAVKRYDRVLIEDENHTSALNSKGIALLELGRYDEVISNFDILLKLQPSNTEALLAKALALEMLGRNNDAIDVFKESMTIYETSVIDYNLFERYLQKEGHIISTEDEKDYVRLLLKTADLLYETNEHEEAQKLIDKASMVDPVYVIRALNSK